MNPIASLSMYDWPEIQDAMDLLWSTIARHMGLLGIEAPAALERVEHPSTLWVEPNLLLGQTCGWPYANTLRGKALPFGRFVYDISATPPGHYQSIYIGRSEEDAGFLKTPDAFMTVETIAMNGDDSQSGFHVFSEILDANAQKVIPDSKKLCTGAHRESIKAVAEGRAQIAAIDSVAFELANRHEPEATRNVTVIGLSKPKPGLPLITSYEHEGDVSDILHAVSTAVRDLPSDIRDELLILDVIPAEDAEYDEFLLRD